MGEHDRRRLDRRRVLRRHLGRPARDQREGGGLQHRARPRARTRRSACRCSTARCRHASGAATPTRSSRASSGPSNLPKLFRDDYVTNSNDSYWLSNPEQPLTGFDRIIGDERTERSLRTRSGLVHGRAAAGGHRRLAREPLHAAAAPGHGVRRTASTPASCGATSWPTSARRRRRWSGSERPGRRQRGLPGAARLGPAGRPRLHGAILFRRFASRALGAVPVAGTPGLFTTQFDANDAVHTPYGLNIAQPGRRAVVRGRRHGPAQRGHPARRAAARLAVRAPRLGADPDPRRPGHRGRVQRDQRRLGRLRRDPGLPERAARVELRDGGAVHGRPGLPGRHAHDPHLLAVDEPELALLRRPDAHVLQQGVGGRGATARTRSPPTRTSR